MNAVAISLSGAQVLVAGAAVSLLTTNKRNGYWGQKHSNDHSPDHIHL